MSRIAKATLVGSIILSGLTVWGVHYLQDWERESMYQGVVRDDARRREKMQQRQAEYEVSRKKRELYEGVQSVSGSADRDSRSGLANRVVPG